MHHQPNESEKRGRSFLAQIRARTATTAPGSAEKGSSQSTQQERTHEEGKRSRASEKPGSVKAAKWSLVDERELAMMMAIARKPYGLVTEHYISLQLLRFHDCP